ncbi:MAG: terminase small subunit [Nitrospirae bacterium]|nr:terminase small subunit [Nitrospirota bacterium]
MKKNASADAPIAILSFACPSCTEPFKVLYEQKGPWKRFNPKVVCTHCHKDVSKQFFPWLAGQQIEFKKSRTVGKKALWGCASGQAGEASPVEICDPKTFEEALSLLSSREQTFVLEYVKTFNGDRSAITAGYSRKTARIQASQLLARVNIRRALKLFYQERRKTALKTVDDIRQELEKIGFTNLTDTISFTRDGLTFVKESDELSEEAKAALKKVKFTENMSGISVEVENHDKVGALKLLGQQQGMFQQKVAVNLTLETYEQRRKRLGLDDMSPQEAREKFLREHPEMA